MIQIYIYIYKAAAPPEFALASLLITTLPGPGSLFLLALFSSKKFCKIFQIPRHIESLDICMEY